MELDSKVVIHYREPEAWSPDEDTNGEYIELAHSEDFFKKAFELSEFIKALPISTDDNNELIDLIFSHMSAASYDAFNQALKLGLILGSQHPVEITQALKGKFSQ